MREERPTRQFAGSALFALGRFACDEVVGTGGVRGCIFGVRELRLLFSRCAQINKMTLLML